MTLHLRNVHFHRLAAGVVFEGDANAALDADGVVATETPTVFAGTGAFRGNRIRRVVHHPGRLPVPPWAPCPCNSGRVYLDCCLRHD